MQKVHIFVTTVGVSNMIYAAALPDEKLPRFIAGTVHALDYCGAIPKCFIPDNLRTAVTKHTKDELILNSAYQDLEQFYEVFILPPPARKPKGKVVSGVFYRLYGKRSPTDEIGAGEYYLARICIHPDYQNKGIARDAILLCEKEFPDARFYCVDFPEDMEKNRRCYQSAR